MYKKIIQPNIQKTLYSDASKIGLGAELDGISTGGNWNHEESLNNINVLELKAAYFALKSFSYSINNKNVKIMVDNNAAVHIINKMGTSHSSQCNSLCFKIWNFCIENGIWLIAAHLPGSFWQIKSPELFILILNGC